MVARGQGQDRVRLTIRNTSGQAAQRGDSAGPGRLGGREPAGAAAAALQSMGLGMFSNRPGSFGKFQGGGSARGFQSVPVERSVASPVGDGAGGRDARADDPGVCLNYGLPTPTPRNASR